jgi:hypothetical protein
MGFFSGKPAHEPSGTFRQTITGGTVTVPEVIGGVERRVRLMGTAVRVLTDHPAARPAALGQPLGDGAGMEDVVDTLRPWFARERSLTRWVALRGALLFADICFGGPADRTAALSAMGLSRDHTGMARVVPGALSAAQVAGCEGLCASLELKLNRYAQIETMSTYDVIDDPELARVNEAVGLDYIAWVGIALLRTGAGAQLLQLPEPGRIEAAGWYAEPLFAKSERYHDGQDWTDRCRVIEGRNAREVGMPLR